MFQAGGIIIAKVLRYKYTWYGKEYKEASVAETEWVQRRVTEMMLER